jgi:hypothetical protein
LRSGLFEPFCFHDRYRSQGRQESNQRLARIRLCAVRNDASSKLCDVLNRRRQRTDEFDTRFSQDFAHLLKSDLDLPAAFAAYLAPLRRIKWYVYAKPPFGGPKAVLAYLARYTHRVAISNSRLIAFNEDGVTFRYKDYRADGRARYKRMTLAPGEFIRRFLIHVLPKGFHRIRHYGLLARPSCADNIARARELIGVPMPQDHNADADAANPNEPPTHSHPCPCCGGRMIIIETFERGSTPRHRPTGPIVAIRIDTS